MTLTTVVYQILEEDPNQCLLKTRDKNKRRTLHTLLKGKRPVVNLRGLLHQPVLCEGSPFLLGDINRHFKENQIRRSPKTKRKERTKTPKKKKSLSLTYHFTTLKTFWNFRYVSFVQQFKFFVHYLSMIRPVIRSISFYSSFLQQRWDSTSTQKGTIKSPLDRTLSF